MNVLILLYLLLILPKLVFDRIFKGKTHPGLLQRMGFNIPDSKGQLIWIHAVSVGEVKAAQPLFLKLRAIYPDHFFLITTTSATGQCEAKRSLSTAHAFAYLPIDLSWIVSRWVSKLKPEKFILIESDFWFNLLAALKKHGAQVILASGKISERSARRFSQFSWFSKKLFSYFDLLCVQNKEQYQRFAPLVADLTRLHITGNLKLDIEAQKVNLTQYQIPGPLITISCTHAAEEEMLLDELLSLGFFIILAPRHPERFGEVADLLSHKKIIFSRWSNFSYDGQVLLVDAMGKLPTCYSLSRLAIVGGSYVSHVGGHNVLEPCLYGVPVIFGPHVYGQSELASMALDARAGIQVSIENIRDTVENFFKDSDQERLMRNSAKELMEMSRGSTSRIIAKLTI